MAQAFNPALSDLIGTQGGTYGIHSVLDRPNTRVDRSEVAVEPVGNHHHIPRIQTLPCPIQFTGRKIAARKEAPLPVGPDQIRADQTVAFEAVTEGLARAALGGCGAGADQRRFPTIKG